ncbi:YeeE/YedE family protein [Lutimonas saemankumensis]|uniref:YeeE/YedE family protein n=1 Tax=Lutimonas saemankumensis TaxID=483016 RepID=UPI001CD6ED23|nr:YeeE/YedE thiosulfate transporter family protein [Lutimonas saemankumensis]MCA0932826.1 YeeE/YedE family protein [Lutimonas saemankumensis]
MDFILQPWPWYVAGPIIAFCMFLMFFFGKKFGVSSNLESVCAMGGAGKFVDFFRFDWKKNWWNLTFVVGLIIGGFIADQWLTPDDTVALNPDTVVALSEIGIQNAGSTYLPDEIFSIDALLTVKGFLILIIAGILVGFGSRYAGGCTSGHGIVGLSSLSMESFIAVGGFFIGGLIMTWLILPYVF